MKGNGKRILSIFLAGVIAVTTVGYAPPFTSAASWKTNMEKALEFLASPSEASKQESTATPSEAESPGREATPSEAEIPDGNATPSQAIKKFVRVEPEEIPEYYSQVSASGKKFWKFEDRNGVMQYRDYGYVQGDAEFPLWYVTDLTGTVDDTYESVNLDEEYYSEAPYIYRSVAPDQTAWTNLSWKLFSNGEDIDGYTKKKISGFENWDLSRYYIWHLLSKGEEEDVEDQVYHFYGTIVNEEEGEGQPGWFYSDEDGVINVNNMLRASLMATTYYDYEWYLDAPGQFRLSISDNQYLIKDRPTMGGGIMYPQKPNQSAIDRGMNFTSKFVAWASGRSNDNSFSVPRYNTSNAVIGYDLLNGDPANIDNYYSGVTLLSYEFIFKSNEWYPRSIYGVWCPDNADMYIFAREGEDRVNKRIEYFNVGNYTYDIQNIKVRRNSSFNIDSISTPTKSGYTFEGWRLGSGYGDYIANGTEINCGSSGKVTWVFPSFKPLENTVTFLDIDGNKLSEQIVLSGNSATAPTPPVISGKIFTSWGGDYSNITKDSEFKAQYKDTVTLTIIGNGGLLDGSETYTKELIYGTSTFDLLRNLEPKTTRSLYKFKGWYTNPEGTGSSYYPSGLGRDLTLYAVWEHNSNLIIYYRNLNSTDTYYERGGYINEGDNIGDPPYFSSSNGKRIVKWHLDKSGYAFEYGSGIQPDYKMPGNTLNLYGKWDNWTVNYTINYGIGDSRPPRTMTLNSSNSNKKLLESYLPSTASMEVPGYISTGYSNGWRDDSGAITASDYNYATTTNRKVYFARTPKALKFSGSFPSNTSSSYESTPANFINGKYGEVLSTDNYNNLIKMKDEKIYDDGRVFEGFYLDRQFTKPLDLSVELRPEDPTQSVNIIDVYIFAKYVKDFTLTFKDWDGSILSNQMVHYGEPVVVPENPTRERYSFVGWDKSYENLQKDTILTAQYELSSPILTLDGNGGSFTDATSITFDVKAGDSLDQWLADGKSQVNRKYYTFDGWYTQPTGGMKYPEIGNFMPSLQDLTLYARWVKSSCEVVFKDWDGTVLEVQDVPIGGDAVNHIPERSNYEFMGWNRSLANIRYDTTITANYTLISDLKYGYNVGFDRYGFNKYTKYVESIPGESRYNVAYLHRKKLPSLSDLSYYLDTDYYNTLRYTSEIDFPKVESDDDNYLIGWTYGSNRGDSYYYNGRGLYQYQSNSYSSYHGQLETDQAKIMFGFPLFQHKDNVKVREYMGLKSNNATIEENNTGFGAVFLTALYLPKDKASLVLVNGSKDFHSTFHALNENNWDKSNIGESNFTTVFQEDTPFLESISVEDFGSKVNIYSSSKYPNQRIYRGKDGKEEILSYKETDASGTSSRSWYTTHKLVGYYSEPNGVGKELLGNYTFTKIDDRYYAYWVPKEAVFNVTFQDNNGAVLGSESVTAGDACKKVPVGSDKPGYKFLGWQPVDSDDNSSTDKVTRDTTFIATYEKIATFKLILEGNGGTLGGSPKTEAELTLDQSFDQILKDGKDLVERPGYQFDGWYNSTSGGTSYSYNGNKMPSMNVTVYAHWTPITYKVTFDPNHKKWGGEEFKEDHTFDTKLGTLPAPEIYGWDFNGWWTGKNGSGTKITEQSMVEPKDMIYYAHWSIGIIDNGNGTYRKPGADGEWNTADDELWWIGQDKLAETSDDKQIFSFSKGTGSYADGRNGTHYRPGAFENWTNGIEHWWNGVDGIPGTDDDLRIYYGESGSSGTPIYYIDSGNGVYIRPGVSGNWGSETEYWWYGPDGIPGTNDDRAIYLYPGSSGYYMDYGNGIYIRPGTGGSWTSGTEHWWYGPDGKPGTSDDREIHVYPGGNGHYIDNGDGTYTLPGTGGSWTSGTEHWWYGPDGKPGTSDDRQIHVYPGGKDYYIDNGDGTYTLPGTGGSWASGTEHWWHGPDGKPGTDDDRKIHVLPGGGYYIDNGDGTYIRPRIGGSWTSGTEHWWYGPDGNPGTDDDRQIHVLPGGGYYIDNGDGTYIRPGTGGSWTNGTEHWWYGPDGNPGTDDDRHIHVLPGGGYYIDNGDGTYIRPGTGGSWTNGTEHWWYGPDGNPGTDDDRQIHILPGGGYYIDNGDGTYIRPRTGGSWTSETEHWWYGPDGNPGTDDDRQIYVLPGGGYYIDNGDSTYIKPGTEGSWTNGTEHWWYDPAGKPGADDCQIHTMPGGNGYYIDNGDGTHIRPGTGGSWDHGTEIWQDGPDGKPGTPDDYKKVDSGNTDPEPTKPDPTDPEPTKPDPTNPEPTKPDPTDPGPTKPEPTDPEPTKPEPSKPEPTNPSKPEPSNETKAGKEDSVAVTVPETPSIDTTSKPSVRDDGGTFKVDPENPKDVIYIKPDGTPAKDEWVGDGTNLYHVNEESKLNYSWFLEKDKTWFMLNQDSGEQFGAALRGWYSESMDKKKYFFDPSTTVMLTGWQRIDNKEYYFTEKNERKTYTGDNRIGWLFDFEILNTPLSRLDRPYGSMYRNEYTPDGYWVDENGVCAYKQ